MQWEEKNNKSVLGVCVCGGDVFVLLLACFAPQFLVLLRRCLKGLSHDSREVKCLTPFS